MKPKKQYDKASFLRKPHTTTTFFFSGMVLLVFMLLPGRAFSQQVNKLQKAIDAIKVVYDNEGDDYITDGQRVVWVKSYKKWIPEDLVIMKKEDPSTLRFLSMAAQRARYDVLVQLLPNYYRARGGVKAFSTDILKK